MPRVVHFEIHADDPERAKTFYENVLGWTFQKWDGPMEYWMVFTGDKAEPGIDGGMHRRMGPGNPGPNDMVPVVGYVCTADVPNVDDYVLRAQEQGGINVVPKMPIPGVGWLAYCKDTEGNIFGMMQSDPSAGS